MSSTIAELEARLANLLRFGTIAEVNYGTRPRVKVDCGNIITDWLPWFTHRAGNDKSWHPPEIGEQVMILSPSGNMRAGAVLPSIFQDDFPAPATVATKDRTVYSDGTFIEYDRATHKLTANVQGEADIVTTGKVKVNAGDNVEVVSSSVVKLTGSSIELHGPVHQSGGDCDFSGTVTATTDVIGGGKSLKNHTHGGVTGGISHTAPPD